jgi:intracellular multiplication protein IcmB
MSDSKFGALLMSIISTMKMDITDFCDIHTVDGVRDGCPSLVANDGSLATIIRYHGTRSVMSAGDFRSMIGQLESSLGNYMRKKGHQIQVVFRKDLDSRRVLNEIANQKKQTADNLRLDLKHLIDEQVDRYSLFVYDESCHLVLWTRPSMLDQTEKKIDQNEKSKVRSSTNMPSMKSAQNPCLPIGALYNRHAAFVSKIVDDLSSPQFGCSVELLNLDEELRTLKRSVLPDMVPDNWEATYPSKPIPFTWKNNSITSDASELFYAPLESQIMTCPAVLGSNKDKNLPDPNTLRMGGRIYAPVLIERPPSDPQFFAELFSTLGRAECIEEETGRKRAMPYAVSFMIEGDGMSGSSFSSLMAQLLSMTSAINRNINTAMQSLTEMQRDGVIIAKGHISAMTWVKESPSAISELAMRKAKLISSLSGWGAPLVTDRSGHAMQAFQSTATGLSYRHIAPGFPVPLYDMLAMLPLSRSASPFPKGSTIYRSLDGKILPYQRFSSDQTTWITLVSGKPGSGKSVLLNYNHVESCLMPGSPRLPYVCIIDIGVSSKGFIDTIQDNLPPNLQYLAFYKRLQNDKRDSINPMDTSLGSRYPLPKDRGFLVNFLTMLVTPPERKGHPFEGMTNFVGRVVDTAYKMRNDKLETGAASKYRPGFNTAIDNAINELGIEINNGTYYWTLVDTFFKAGRYYEAEVAQRYAVPILQDLVGAASSSEITSEYGSTTVENGTPLIKAFQNGINEAITEYPLFSQATQFDIGSARCMAIDLQDLAIVGSDSDKKRTALMYMISRQVFMKKVAFSMEDLPFFNPEYRNYFDRIINEVVEDPKVLCMDEYHMTGKDQLLTEQVKTDGRTARKWKMEIMLASQLMDDFGDVVQIATSFFIVDSGTEETREYLKTRIGLNSVHLSALTSFVHGPKRQGSTFLAVFRTKSATFYQLFTLSVGPMLMWSLSTTAEDRKLRDLLYRSIPKLAANKLLAKRFPGGTCKDAVEELQRELFSEEFVDEEQRSSVVDRLAKDLISQYRHESLNQIEAI